MIVKYVTKEEIAGNRLSELYNSVIFAFGLYRQSNKKAMIFDAKKYC